MKVNQKLVILVLVCLAALSANGQQITEVSKRIRVGAEVQQAKLISQAPAVYPPLAQQARIRGIVKLEVGISPEGTVDELKVISGHPLLVTQAMEAVRQWKYRTTLLNGAPIGVVTTVDVYFGFEENTALESTEMRISSAEEADIRKLLALTGIAKSLTDSAKQMAKAMKAGILSNLEPGAPVQLISARLDEKLGALLDSDNHLKPVVALYAKRYSHEDILNLIRFFETPVGQNYTQEMTQVSSNLMFTVQGWLHVQLDRIAREIREEFPAAKKP